MFGDGVHHSDGFRGAAGLRGAPLFTLGVRGVRFSAGLGGWELWRSKLELVTQVASSSGIGVG